MEELTRIRAERGWTQQRLADESGVNKATINQIERGRRSPNVETLEKLAVALGAEVADFFPKAQAPLPLQPLEVSAAERSGADERRLRSLSAWRAFVHGLARRWRENPPKTSAEISPLFEAMTALVQQGIFEPSDARDVREAEELMGITMGFQRLNDIADKVEKEEEAEQRRATFALIQEQASA